MGFCPSPRSIRSCLNWSSNEPDSSCCSHHCGHHGVGLRRFSSSCACNLVAASRTDVVNSTESATSAPLGAMCGMTAVRSSLSTRGISQRVANTILASRRDSTIGQYEDRWTCYVKWCLDRGTADPFSADLVEVLDFLQSRLDAGLAASTVRGYSTAISTFHNPIDGCPAGQHPLIIRFLAGVDNVRPITRRFSPTWDLNVVLDWLQGPTFTNLTDLSLQQVTWKTVFLVAVATGRRVGDIHAFSPDPQLTVFHKDRVSIRLPDTYRPKVAHNFHVNAPIELPVLYKPGNSAAIRKQSHALDVRRMLKFYIKLTSSLRRNHSQLFICYGKSALGAPATTQTLSRWLVSCIAEAYKAKGLLCPDGLKAHSVRAIATSTAFSAALPIEEVCSAAIWKRASTFTRHYQLDMKSRERASFGSTVLLSGQRPPSNP